MWASRGVVSTAYEAAMAMPSVVKLEALMTRSMVAPWGDAAGASHVDRRFRLIAGWDAIAGREGLRHAGIDAVRWDDHGRILDGQPKKALKVLDVRVVYAGAADDGDGLVGAGNVGRHVIDDREVSRNHVVDPG